MDTQVQPVLRGEFLYRDVFFVDVGGEGKRHTRASPSEIQDLLNGKAAKDQVGHWYEAQLIHYGLLRSKEKNTAKVRLQQALGKNALSVPQHLIDMEAQMKKEYAAAVRKAKVQSKGDKDVTTPASFVAQKKRKASEEAHGSVKKTKISVTVVDVSFNIEHDTTAATTKKSTTKETAKAKTASTKIEIQAKASDKVAGAKPATERRTSLEPAKAASKPDPQQSAKATSSKAKARKTEGTLPISPAPAKAKSIPKARSEANIESEPKVKSEPKGKAESKVKAGPKVKAEPEVKKEPKVKKEPVMKATKPIKQEHIENEPEAMEIDGFQQEMPGTTNVTGVYDLKCFQIAEQLPEEADRLRLFLAVDKGQIWGGFELAMKTGVILVDTVAVGQTVSFGWRARDSWDDGRMRFGKGCFGDIVLHGRNQVRATFYNLFPGEPIVVEGHRRPGPLWCGRSPYSFRQEWEGFVKEAYG